MCTSGSANDGTGGGEGGGRHPPNSCSVARRTSDPGRGDCCHPGAVFGEATEEKASAHASDAEYVRRRRFFWHRWRPGAGASSGDARFGLLVHPVKPSFQT